jgi:hypothetical protein
MIRKLTILSCCVAAAVAVSLAEPSEAEAQAPLLQRASRPGHFVGNSARRAYYRTNRFVTNSTNRWLPSNNYNHGYNNGYQNQQFNAPANTPTPATPVPTRATPVNATGARAMVTPAQTYTPIP